MSEVEELILENQIRILLALSTMHPDREVSRLLKCGAELTTKSIEELAAKRIGRF